LRFSVRPAPRTVCQTCARVVLCVFSPRVHTHHAHSTSRNNPPGFSWVAGTRSETARAAASGIPVPRRRATRAQRRGHTQKRVRKSEACGETRVHRGRSGASPGGTAVARKKCARGAAPLWKFTQGLCRGGARKAPRGGDPPFAQVPGHPCSLAVGTEPCPAPASSHSARSLLRQPRSALGARRPRLTSTASLAPPRTPTATGANPVARAMGAGLERHPFSGPADSVGELLHTP
jgi:hypothetical protein